MVEKTDNSETMVIPATAIAAVSVENVAMPENKLNEAQANPVDTAETKTSEPTILVIAEQSLPMESDSTLLSEPEKVSQSDQTVEENPKVLTTETKPAEEHINFNINNEITYIAVSNFKTAEGKIYFEEGNLKQTELDEIIKETEKLRERYSTSKSRSEKDSIGQQILSLESQTYELKSVVNQLFLQSKTAENGYWQNATPEEKELFIRELNTTTQELDNSNQINNESVSATPELIISPIFIEDEKVKSEGPKVKTSGVTYKIQIGAYSRGIPNNQKQAFNKISVIRKVENYTDANGVVVYTTGNLTNYEDAVQMQNQVKQEGIKDPLIAAYLNGKRITLEQAKEIEKKK
jgi:hypothetical protein